MIHDMKLQIDEMVAKMIDNALASGEMEKVSAEDLGLDRRAGAVLFVTREQVGVHKNRLNDLDYYGGFEYVAGEYITRLGDYVFFDSIDDRVGDALAFYFNS